MSSKYILDLKLDDDFPSDLRDYYESYSCNGSDSGIDLIVPESVEGRLDGPITINHKISCQLCKYKNDVFVSYVGYWLLPRSSISKTNFRMANSMGLIDSGYRGNIMSKVDTLNYSNDIEIKKGVRLFQLALGNLKPISEVRVVESLSDTERGSGGFGSTGK